MALRADYLNEQNETIPNCYWKLGVEDGITGGKHGMKCKLYCYETKEDGDLNQNELYVYPFHFDFEIGKVENIFIQIYEHLKQHNMFEEAIDV